jgi:hypothetical protein
MIGISQYLRNLLMVDRPYDGLWQAGGMLRLILGVELKV